MFARLTILNLKPERVDEGIDIYRKSVVPAAKSQKGFVTMYFLSDRPTGRNVSVSFWKTEADALANEHNLFYQEQILKFLDMLASPPIREGYEVTVKA